MRNTPSDYEIAMPLYEVYSMVRGEGYYADLPPDILTAQVDRLIEVSQDLYPRLRIYLFDARRLYSAPITIFGPRMAVLYIGQTYMAFRDTERVQALTQHFDHLVREAQVTARQLPDHLRALTART
jgi:hypothetical protein